MPHEKNCMVQCRAQGAEAKCVLTDMTHERGDPAKAGSRHSTLRKEASREGAERGHWSNYCF